MVFKEVNASVTCNTYFYIHFAVICVSLEQDVLLEEGNSSTVVCSVVVILCFAVLRMQNFACCTVLRMPFLL